jgi:UDPglucose 6-dehydrogenase
MPPRSHACHRLVAANMRERRLDFTTDLPGPVAEADAVFIAVGTPSRRGDGHADLGYVHTAAREIAAAVSGFTVVVTKSTVPVGTGDEVERIISETRRGGGVQCGISARGGCCGGACTEKPWPHSLQVRSRHNLEPRGSCERCGIITVA